MVIHEWNLLRVVACLSIVVLHATSEIQKVAGKIDNETIQLVRVLLTYATPTFVLLSIVIIANRYKEDIPKGFLVNRLKYIYFPFVFFSFIYAFYWSYIVPNYAFTERFVRNVFLGDFVGWFVLAILQLYFIFWIMKKINVSAEWLLPLMFFIGLLFLTFLNNVSVPDPNLNSVLKILFFTWLVYYSVAYVIGTYYEIIINYAVKYRYISILLVLISIGIIAINFFHDKTAVHSRRLDIVPLVFAMTLMVLGFGAKLPRWRIVDFLSGYAFGIYLIHRLIQYVITPYIVNINSLFGQITVVTVSSVLLSIIILKLISYLPYSEYMIGNIRKYQVSSELDYNKFAHGSKKIA